MESYTKKQRMINIGGRAFPLAFPMKAYLEMINTIDGFDFSEVNKMISDPNKMMPMMFILAKYGAILNGAPLDVDLDWMEIHTPSSARKIIAIQLAVIKTINDWMEMETEEDEDLNREVDLVLRDLQKKSKRTSSPGGKSQPGDSSAD